MAKRFGDDSTFVLESEANSETVTQGWLPVQMVTAAKSLATWNFADCDTTYLRPWAANTELLDDGALHVSIFEDAKKPGKIDSDGCDTLKAGRRWTNPR